MRKQLESKHARCWREVFTVEESEAKTLTRRRARTTISASHDECSCAGKERGRQQIVSRRRTLTVFVTGSHRPAALWWPRSPGCIHCPRCHWWLSHETGRRWTASTLKGRRRDAYVMYSMFWCMVLVLYFIIFKFYTLNCVYSATGRKCVREK